MHIVSYLGNFTSLSTENGNPGVIISVWVTLISTFPYPWGGITLRLGQGGDILPPWVQIPGDDNALAGGWEIRVENLH